MKSTGIVRKLDELGRITIPVEIRKIHDIKEGDPLEIFVEGSNIIVAKYQPSCIFCQSTLDIVDFKGKNICRHCIEDLK